MFSPHAWGWSAHRRRDRPDFRVLPTRVGMVRAQPGGRDEPGGSPHTRGDGPIRRGSDPPRPLFSPHAWGWSARAADGARGAAVLPTRVGMVRTPEPTPGATDRSPHTRGDGPGA